MRIEPVDDIQRVLKISWSFWASIIALVLLVGKELLYALVGWDFDPRIMGYVIVGLLLFSIGARAIKQTGSVWRNWIRILGFVVVLIICSVSLVRADTAPGHCGKPCVATEAQTMQILIPLVQKWEGTRLKAYRDVVGVPTICTGSTRGVTIGMTKTAAECAALLRLELREYRLGVHKGFSSQTLTYRLPPPRDAAFTDLGYNIGQAGVRRSTATRRLNAGDVPGACDAIGWYTRAGGKIWLGLQLRRADDVGLCRVGL